MNTVPDNDKNVTAGDGDCDEPLYLSSIGAGASDGGEDGAASKNQGDKADEDDGEEELELEDEDGARSDSTPIIVSEPPVNHDHDRPDLHSDSDGKADDSEDEDYTSSDSASISQHSIGLEAPRCTQTPASPEVNSISSQGSDHLIPELSPSEHENSPAGETMVDRRELEQVLENLGSPTVTKYPGGNAGMVHSKRSITENEKYEAKVGKGSQANHYAPFASSMDWQVAKWAKLRGPSSSAFSELIAIDGVSQFSVINWHWPRS
jgi:hypothetical protein